MRMKFNKSSQLLLVSAASLLVAGLVTACGTLTTDFVYVASAKAAGTNNYGEIDVFEINSESGRMRQIPASPFPSEGRNPVAEAVSSDYASLYVVNQDDNNIVQFTIGSDGKLYPQQTVNTPGIYPMAVAANGSNLFVVDTYQPLASCSTAAPCSGSIGVFPIIAATSTAASSIGTAVTNTSNSSNYWPLTLSGKNSSDVIVPTAVNVVASSTSATYVYVTAYDSTASPNVGYIFGFAVGSDSTLTALSGSPYSAGTLPAGISSDSAGQYVYVTDKTNGTVLAYSVASGALTLSGTYAAGNGAMAIAVDPSYNFAYVANSVDDTITAYSISNGVLTRIGTYSTGLQPVAIGIDPSTRHFVYTVNYLGSTVSDFLLSTTDGTLLVTQYSPFVSNALPTAVAAVPHGTVLK
jgi:6-phosphogluconolactonase (cycloisomerase 2 family)